MTLSKGRNQQKDDMSVLTVCMVACLSVCLSGCLFVSRCVPACKVCIELQR